MGPSSRQTSPSFATRAALRLLSTAVAAAFFAAACSRVGLEPELERAWVAILPAGEEVARVGRVELEAGREFTLHAVIEGRDWRGDRVYFTEAPALEIGGVQVASEAVRPWARRLRVRTLWFTVEAFPPYAKGTELVFRDVFRSDWPLAWSVDGDIVPSVENYLPDQREARRVRRFGTQRFKVRVELLGPESEILPRQSLESWGAERLPAESDGFPTVVARLAPPLASLSRVFGLAQREPADQDRAAALAQIAAWQRQDLAFSRLTSLRAWIDEVGTPFADLPWHEVDLVADTPFGAPGEPLRVGERVVWLLEDRGAAGRLDREDLCLDFERGARVRRLSDVFTGEGLVERARLEPSPNWEKTG